MKKAVPSRQADMVKSEEVLLMYDRQYTKSLGATQRWWLDLPALLTLDSVTQSVRMRERKETAICPQV